MVLNTMCSSSGRDGDLIVVLRGVPAIGNAARERCGKSATAPQANADGARDTQA
jgi:hypothetical protein